MKRIPEQKEGRNIMAVTKLVLFEWSGYLNAERLMELLSKTDNIFFFTLHTDAFTSDKLLLQWSTDGVIIPRLELTNYDVEQAEKSAGVEFSAGRSIVGNDVRLPVCFERLLFYTTDSESMLDK